MEEEDDEFGDIFGSENMISTPQTFTRFASPDTERGAVMVEWPRKGGMGFKPHPKVRDSWDDRHVRMPFSKVTVSSREIFMMICYKFIFLLMLIGHRVPGWRGGRGT